MLTFPKLNQLTDLNWLKGVDYVKLAMVKAIGNFNDDTFEAEYSEELSIYKAENI